MEKMMEKMDMSKGGNVSDDFTFIKAFEEAMSFYKKMHKIGKTESAKVDGASSVSSTEKNANLDADVTDTVVRKTENPEEDCSKTKTTKTENPPMEAESSNDSQPTQEDQDVIQSAEKYNKLIDEYNAIEKTRLEIVEQIYGYHGISAQHYNSMAYQTYYPAPMVVALGGYVYPYPVWPSNECRGCCVCVTKKSMKPVDDNNTNQNNHHCCSKAYHL